MVSNKKVIEEVLQALGLQLDSWTNLARIDAGCAFVIANIDMLDSLPKKVKGDLSNLSSLDTLKRRKCVCGLSRRLAKAIEAAVLRKRKQIFINNKTISMYEYKLIS